MNTQPFLARERETCKQTREMSSQTSKGSLTARELTLSERRRNWAKDEFEEKEDRERGEESVAWSRSSTSGGVHATSVADTRQSGGRGWAYLQSPSSLGQYSSKFRIQPSRTSGLCLTGLLCKIACADARSRRETSASVERSVRISVPSRPVDC